MTNTIHLMCHNSGIIAVGECEGIRERAGHEAMHCRDREDDIVCSQCGQVASPWLGSRDRWASHPARCRPTE